MACATGELRYGEARSGPVRISIGVDDAVDNSDVATAISDAHFSYVDPVVTHLFPLKGPKSGGTKITIKGTITYSDELYPRALETGRGRFYP